MAPALPDARVVPTAAIGHYTEPAWIWYSWAATLRFMADGTHRKLTAIVSTDVAG